MVLTCRNRESRPDGEGFPPDLGPVTGLEELYEAWSLVYRNYRESDFIPPNPFRLHATPSATGPKSVVLVLRTEGVVTATLTAMGDNLRHGLPLDRVFPEELTRLREEGRNLMEAGLFACASERLRDPASVVELLRTAFCYGVAARHTDLLCGVNPRHARFYELMFGFRPAGPVVTYPSLNHAPVVLLRAEVRDVFGGRRRFRGLMPLGEGAFSRSRFVPRFCPSREGLEASVIGQYLWACGISPSYSCSREYRERPRCPTPCCQEGVAGAASACLGG